MRAAAEKIPNRNSIGPWWPPWLSNPMLLVAALWSLLAIANIAEERLLPGYEWAPWLWGMLILFWVAGIPLQIWASGIRWIQVGADGMTVRHGTRSDGITMSDILQVDVHRHWRNPLARSRGPAYRIQIHRASGGILDLQFLAPEAGDRLLYNLYGYKKPIWVFR